MSHIDVKLIDDPLVLLRTGARSTADIRVTP